MFIPSINRRELVLETLQSLPISVKQVGNLNLKVTVIGNSNDGTQESIKESYGERVKYIGEDDLGIYDALGKNLSKVTDDYVTWLGAGDMWVKDAPKTINEMIEKNKKWFMGRPLVFNSSGVIEKIYPVREYKARLIVEGWHDGYLPLIQQESTIWHASLHKHVDWIKFRDFRLAGDYYLWTCFARAENLYPCLNHIGGYRIHENSLSGRFFNEYRNEIRIINGKTFYGRILAIIERNKLALTKIRSVLFKNRIVS
jgi:hypothetical protein